MILQENEFLERCQAVIAQPLAASRQLAAAGRLSCGLLCPNLPAELPHALGFQPVRLTASQEHPRRAAQFLQTFCCSWVQSLLDQGCAGELAHLAALVFPANTCDSFQNLPDIWRRVVSAPPGEALYRFHFPVHRTGRAPLELLEHEISAWQRWLEQRCGRDLSAAQLESSVRLFNRTRGALRRLQALASQGQLPYSMLHTLAVAAQLMDHQEVADQLEALVAEASATFSPRVAGRTRLILVGGHLDSPRLIRWLEEHEVDVVDEDTCAISRSFEEAADLDPLDPLADMARRHLRRSPCPVQLNSGEHRRARLVSRIRKHNAQGVLLLPYRGCEPHAYDNVLLCEALDQMAIPHLTLEIEPHLGNWGQLTTRLAAFLEMFSDLDQLFG